MAGSSKPIVDCNISKKASAAWRNLNNNSSSHKKNYHSPSPVNHEEPKTGEQTKSKMENDDLLIRCSFNDALLLANQAEELLARGSEEVSRSPMRLDPAEHRALSQALCCFDEDDDQPLIQIGDNEMSN